MQTRERGTRRVCGRRVLSRYERSVMGRRRVTPPQAVMASETQVKSHERVPLRAREGLVRDLGARALQPLWSVLGRSVECGVGEILVYLECLPPAHHNSQFSSAASDN